MFGQQLVFSKIDQQKCLNHQVFEGFILSFSNSSTASLNVPNILVTNTDVTIVERDVSSLFLAICPMPLRRLHTAGHVEVNETQLFILIIGRFVHSISPQTASCQAHKFVKSTNLACGLLCKIEVKTPTLSTFAGLLTKH